MNRTCPRFAASAPNGRKIGWRRSVAASTTPPAGCSTAEKLRHAIIVADRPTGRRPATPRSAGRRPAARRSSRRSRAAAIEVAGREQHQTPTARASCSGRRAPQRRRGRSSARRSRRRRRPTAAPARRRTRTGSRRAGHDRHARPAGRIEQQEPRVVDRETRRIVDLGRAGRRAPAPGSGTVTSTLDEPGTENGAVAAGRSSTASRTVPATAAAPRVADLDATRRRRSRRNRGDREVSGGRGDLDATSTCSDDGTVRRRRRFPSRRAADR